jgi:tetratricopeptide (TPR) repeat protein
VCRKVALTVIEFQEDAAHDAAWTPAASATEPTAVEMRERRWSSEKTRAPAMAISFAVLLTVVAIPLFDLFFKSPHRAPVETLASAAAGQRTISARVSGGSAFAPRPGEQATTLPERSPLLLAANRVRREYAEDFAPPSRRAVGVAALLAGDPDAAVASLSIAALAAPNEGHVANDLAAAYYERSRRLGAAGDLPPALDAAERAVRLQPELLEAWFNRALIITAFGLRIEARAAWQDYLRRDASSPWADEAREREQQLATVYSASAWLDLERAFERDGGIETAKGMVAHNSSSARDLFEKRLAEWAKAARTGADPPLIRARISALGEAFWQVQQERFYQDIATSLSSAASAPQRRALATAHVAFGDARDVSISVTCRSAVSPFVRARRSPAPPPCCGTLAVRWRCAQRWKRSPPPTMRTASTRRVPDFRSCEPRPAHATTV